MNKLLIDLPEEIQTPRLTLKVPKAGMGEKVHGAILDGYEDYVDRLNWPKTPPDKEAVEIECRQHNAEFILREFIRYVIFDKSTNEVVGRCAFPPFQCNWDIPQFGISYFIRKAARDTGYATEASHAMTLLAFKILKARKVEICCDAENVASAKVPLKLGFELEYAQKGGWTRGDGELAEIRTYSMFSGADLPKLDIAW